MEESPFLPPNSGAGGGETKHHPLELRGIFKDGSHFEFSIYDTAKKQSVWVKLDQPGHDFVVRAYDSGKQAVTVEQQHQTYVLTLSKSKIVPLKMSSAPGRSTPGVRKPAGPMPPGMRRFPNQQGRGPSVVRGPNGVPIPTALTPEQLRNLEADINRRRELRRQAAAAMQKRQGH